MSPTSWTKAVNEGGEASCPSGTAAYAMRDNDDGEEATVPTGSFAITFGLQGHFWCDADAFGGKNPGPGLKACFCAAASPPPPPPCHIFYSDTDYYGHDTGGVFDEPTTAAECAHKCEEQGATYFTFGARCYCKTATAEAGRRTVVGMTSGQTCFHSPPSPPPASPPAIPRPPPPPSCESDTALAQAAAAQGHPDLTTCAIAKAKGACAHAMVMTSLCCVTCNA